MPELPAATTLTIGDKTYRLKPLVLGDLLELAKYHRDRIIEEAKRNMVGLPFDLAKYAWDEAKAETKKIEVGSAEFKNAVLSFEGLIHGLWVSIRSAHAELQLKDVAAIFETDVKLATDKAAEVMGYLSSNPTTPPK